MADSPVPPPGDLPAVPPVAAANAGAPPPAAGAAGGGPVDAAAVVVAPAGGPAGGGAGAGGGGGTGGGPAGPGDPTPLVVAPPTVTLTGSQAQVFSVSPAQRVHWSLLPPDASFGAIDAHSGAYTAPRRLWRGAMAVVRAQNAAGAVATATVTLNPEPFWRNFVGFLLLLMLVPIALFVRAEWPAPCQCDAPSVTPAVAWLKPGDILPMSLAACPPKPSPITWKVANGGGSISGLGVFTASPLVGGAAVDVVVQALDSDQKVLGTATVHVSATAHLSVWPPEVSLLPGEHQTFTLESSVAKPSVMWSMDPPARGSLDQNGKFTALSGLDGQVTIRVIATLGAVAAPDAALSGQSVAALVHISPKANCKDIYWFVCWMGLLGSYIHTALSFAAYAGNRKFLSSWTWWYALRPPTGGLLAVLVFFLFGGGFLGKSDVSNSYMVATYAGLVGLFSEIAVAKLKEIMEMLLKPKDERADKITGQDGSVAKPVISGVVLESGRTYAVAGSGFASGARVKVGTQARDTTFVSDSKLTFTLLATDSGSLHVTVSNPKPDGTTVDSAPATLTVT